MCCVCEREGKGKQTGRKERGDGGRGEARDAEEGEEREGNGEQKFAPRRINLGV